MKYKIRTDLIDFYVKNNDLTKLIKTKQINNIKISSYKLNKINAKKLKKKEGYYKTISFKKFTSKLCKVISDELKELYNINDNDSVLIVGLGNSDITADALGPKSVKEINTTLNRKIYTLIPGVMADTGMETSDIIKGIVKMVKPNLVIVIDALACESIERLNYTIQITDTGIHPGAGIRNKRKEISKEVLGVPVIAIGVPTVIDLGSIIYDSLNFFYENYCHILNQHNILLSKDDIIGIIGNLENYEINTILNNEMMVTTKDIDFMIAKESKIIGDAINKFMETK